MSIMDVFSGKRDRIGAQIAAQQAAQDQQIATQWLLDGQTSGIGAIKDATTQATGAIDAAQPLQLAALGSGYDAARARYSPYMAEGASADNLYGDSLGLHGAEGNDRAVGAFRAAPGYQWAVDQSTEAAKRSQSAIGQLGSGNTMTEISDRAGHMADQQYGGWQDRLKGVGDRGFNATGTVAGFDAQQGRDTSGVYGDNATRRAGIYEGAGRSQAGLYGSTAAGIAGTLSDLSKSTQDATYKAFGAGNKADANAMNFGMNLADLGSRFFIPKGGFGSTTAASPLSKIG